MPCYTIGLDLGQAADFTALTIAERFIRPTGRVKYYLGDPRAPSPQYEDVFHLVHLERFDLGTPYPTVVDRVCALMDSPPLRAQATLVVDATGVGRPVVDLFNERKPGGRWPVPITITGGDTAEWAGPYRRVPKRDLAGGLQLLLQSGRLKIAEELPLAEVLMQELLAFRVKINLQTGHDSYEAWREKEHDDLVLAVALACYWKHNRGNPKLLDPLPGVRTTWG